MLRENAQKRSFHADILAEVERPSATASWSLGAFPSSLLALVWDLCPRGTRMFAPQWVTCFLCGATHLKQKEASLFHRWGCGVQKGRVRGPTWIRAGRQTWFPPSAALPCSFPGAATPAAGMCEPHEKQHVNCCGL